MPWSSSSPIQQQTYQHMELMLQIGWNPASIASTVSACETGIIQPFDDRSRDAVEKNNGLSFHLGLRRREEKLL